MAHQHHHTPASFGRAFALAVLLNLSFVAIEFGFGQVTHSLALVADAGHNLSDVLGLLLAWGASILARRYPSERRTYGWRRTTILAALTNAVVLLIAVGAIAWEAVQRLGQPSPIASGTMMLVAAAGIVVNAGTALLFARGRHSDLNIRGAFLHMAADAGISLGVVVAGGIMLVTGWLWLDPVISLVLVAVILVTTWELLRDSLNLALDAVPEAINLEEVRAYLVELPTVLDVHDLHVWGMSTTETALTAHLLVGSVPADDQLLLRATEELHDKFGIEHTTLQVEMSDLAHRCCLEPFRGSAMVASDSHS